MEYKNLGNSGLKISKIIMGCMSYSESSWSDWIIEDEEKVFSLMKKAYDVGIRTFDTADTYSNGQSEILIGKFLKKYSIKRSSVVILTKCFSVSDPIDKPPATALIDPAYGPVNTKQEYINRVGLSRKHLMDAVDDSIERLGTYIDVYQIHRLDPTTPKLEIMSTLNDIVTSGKVRYIGASSMRAVEFAQLQFIAENHNLTKFISMQNFYNLLYREEEREMIPFCNETGVGIIPWSPLARGILARPIQEKASSLRAKTDFIIQGYLKNSSDSLDEIHRRVEKLAKEKGVLMSQIAMAYVISKGMCPIIGFSSERRIDEAIKGLKVVLSTEDIKYLEEPYTPQTVVGF